MKLILSFILLFSLVINSFAAPLIFKTTKEIKGNDFVELATVDTKIFNQIRVSVTASADETISQNAANGKKFRVAIYAVEDNKEIFLQDQNAEYVQFKTVIDTPPSKIRIKVRGETTYFVHIWGNN